MMHRILVIAALSSTLAIFAADPDISLLDTKLHLRKQLVVSIPHQTDGTKFTYAHELQDILTCIKPFELLIQQAESTEECDLIQQKLNLAKILIRNNRTIFAGIADRRAVYTTLIPRIVELPELWSPYDTRIDVKSWQHR